MTEQRTIEQRLYAWVPESDGSKTTWPLPGTRLGELEWTLRYGKPTTSDLLAAASVLSAYRELIAVPEIRRRHVVRELRKGVQHG